MGKSTKQEAEAARFRQDIRSLLHTRVREAIEIALEEELAEALGCGRYKRSDERLGYRNGKQQRTITTAYGAKDLEIPRGRLVSEDGTSEEFRSQIVPRYQRRSREVDEAILGAYLAGANSRRIKRALAPLLGQRHLSKSAVSRVVSRLKEHFARWSERDLSEERYAIVYLDGFHMKVRLARRVVSAPVLAVLGVAEDGSKVLVSLRLAVSEAGVHWRRVIEDLKARGLAAPGVIVSDGHKGLAKACEVWPEAKVQRCTQHKWTNLKMHCPVHAQAELKRDWDAIVRADDGLQARAAYRAFLEKWTKLVPAVARSLEEAGLELLTFYSLPKSMWKSLRTTNALENLNREFRRRTKTQGSFATEAAGVTLLWGLVAFGQIRLRRIDGCRDMYKLLRNEAQEAA
jgi:transposase-like protein